MAIYWGTCELVIVPLLRMLDLAAELTPGETPESFDMTFNKQIRFWKDTAGKLKNQELAAKSLKLAEKARIYRNHRDLLVHGIVEPDRKGNYFATPMSTKRTRKRGTQKVPVPTSKILKNASETRALTRELFQHLGELAAYYRTWIETRIAQDQTQGNDPSPSTLGKP